jgi:hypothetical protein
MSTSSCLTSVKAPGEGVFGSGRGKGVFGVEGVELSRRVGIAVGFLACLAAFAFDFPLPLDEEDVLAVFEGLLGVSVGLVAVMVSPGSRSMRAADVEEAVTGEAPWSLEGPASGVAI